MFWQSVRSSTATAWVGSASNASATARASASTELPPRPPPDTTPSTSPEPPSREQITAPHPIRPVGWNDPSVWTSTLPQRLDRAPASGSRSWANGTKGSLILRAALCMSRAPQLSFLMEAQTALGGATTMREAVFRGRYLTVTLTLSFGPAGGRRIGAALLCLGMPHCKPNQRPRRAPLHPALPPQPVDKPPLAPALARVTIPKR